MKTSLALFLALFVCQITAFAQDIHNLTSDTIVYQDRTGGSIDTFDLTSNFPISSAPNGGFYALDNSPSIAFFRQSSSLYSVKNTPYLKQWKVSALPHLGFQYAVGSNAIQFLHVDYQQVYLNGLLLNINLDNNSCLNTATQSGLGLMSNGGFQNRNIAVGLRYSKRRFDVELNGGVLSNLTYLSGGIDDSLAYLIDAFGLKLVTPNKANTNSEQKKIGLSARLRYDLMPDSSKTKLGIQTLHHYTLWNRVYNEVDDSLNNIYSQVNLDTNITRDQFQDTKLKNGAGVFFSSKKLQLDALLTHRYWAFQNLGTHRDTNEFGFEGNLHFQTDRLKVNSHVELNLVGAQQEFRMDNSARYGTKTKGIGIGFNQSNLLPDLVQRAYFSNNLNYSNTLFKQSITDISIQGDYSVAKIEAQLRAGSLTWVNNLVWGGNNWVRNEFSDQSFLYADLKFHFDFGVFQFYPNYKLQQGSEFIPAHTINARFLVKKRVFEAKKLLLAWAVDPLIRSDYKLLEYNTLLDNYQFTNTANTGGQNFTLNSTFSLGIDEFRFYIKAENIQHFWTTGVIEEVRNYYRAPFLFRIGFTWDFFN